ncbi:unnamed protein product [Linum trigynum]|uniref:Uncharacterized protein n=1 Tax=Linum trigynum TaxID=586398 RepID=A0AAV2CUA1_9ROSI
MTRMRCEAGGIEQSHDGTDGTLLLNSSCAGRSVHLGLRVIQFHCAEAVLRLRPGLFRRVRGNGLNLKSYTQKIS